MEMLTLLLQLKNELGQAIFQRPHIDKQLLVNTGKLQLPSIGPTKEAEFLS